MGDKLTNRQGKGKYLSVENLVEFIGGKLPLSLLSEDVRTYIDDRIALLAPSSGGGSVENADNTRASVSVNTTTETTVVSRVADGVWRLVGFSCWGNLTTAKGTADDATVTLYDNSDVLYRTRIDDFAQGAVYTLPNPEEIASGHTITVRVERISTTAGNMTFYGTLFGV